MRLIFRALWLLFLCWLYCNPGGVWASENLIFADDFSGDLSNWQLLRGSSLNWQIVDGELWTTVNFPSQTDELAPIDDLWQSNLLSYRVEFEYTALAGADRNFAFGILGPDDWSEFHLVGDRATFVYVRAGQEIFKQGVDYYLTNNDKHLVQIEVGPSLAVLTIDGVEINRVENADLSISPGRFALKVGTGWIWPVRVKYDNLKIWGLTYGDPIDEEQSGEVSLIKQNDARWAGLEYDHATDWTDLPTISRWGCALTSLAMIMRHHGITTLPNGLEILPDTLNDWLNSQPDGYIGEGLVNWAAASRLTREISELYQTPKLEYRRILDQPLAAAQNQLQQNLPVIFNIPEHFLVADKVIETNPDQPDFQIKDPFYNYQTFSQHQKPLLSIRAFKPSFTDLSYLVLAAPPNVQIQVLDTNGNDQTDQWLSFEQLNGMYFGSQILEIPQPEAGNYQILLSSNQVETTDIDLFAYDQTGEVTNLSFSTDLSPEPQTYTVDYQLDSPAILVDHQQVDIPQIQARLDQLKNQGQFYHLHPYLQLTQILTWAKEYPAEKFRYLKFFLWQLENESEFLSTEAAEQLHDLAVIMLADENK